MPVADTQARNQCCDLSEPRQPTLYEDDICRITICQRCEVPMVVLNAHRKRPLLAELKHIQDVCDDLYPNVPIDDDMRSIKDHWHAHLGPRK